MSYPVFLHAQVEMEDKTVKVGQVIPEVVIEELVNDRYSSRKLSDIYKNKLLILDFWATWCSPCVSMFPKMNALEKKFGGEVEFLSVTKEPKKKVTAFFENMYNINGLKPRSVVNDSSINSLFYYASLPYYVWIDSGGKVIAKTGLDAITAENITNVLRNKPIGSVNRIDGQLKNIDYKKSVFVLNNRLVLNDTSSRREEIEDENILSYSIATGYMENGPGKFVFDSRHLAAINIGISLLYRFYYDLAYYDKPARGAFASARNQVFEIKDPSVLDRITMEGNKDKTDRAERILQWSRQNAVCYEIMYPDSLSWTEKMKLVKHDLDRYFADEMGFKTGVERRTDSNTYVLQPIKGNQTTWKTSQSAGYEQHDRYHYAQVNMPLSKLIEILRAYFFQGRPAVFIDRTGIDHNVDLELNCDMSDIQSINKALSSYGLRFNKEISEIDVLVFSDK